MPVAGWQLPGYDVERLLGAGSAGEVWLARDRSTREPVAVRVLATESPEQLDRLRRAAVALAGVRHPHLLRLRTVLPVSGGVALVSDYAAGGSLAGLLAARGALTAGEVVTVGAPLAAALAAVHGQGRAHGRLRASAVLFTADGRPLLADLGLATLGDEPGGTPAADVLALGEVLGLALGPDAPAELRACVERAVAADPTYRPSAEELARDLRLAARPAPVGLGAASRGEEAVREAPASSPPAGQRSRPSPVLLLGLPVVLAAAVLAGRAWAAADRPAGPAPLQVLRSTPPSVAVAGTDWPAVLARLDARRDAALVNLDPAALAEVYAAGAAPMERDLAAIRQLVAAGAHAQGLRLQLESVRLLRRTPAGVTVRVVDRLAPYDVVGSDGRVLEHRPGRGAIAWLVELVPAGEGWRIAAVARS